MSDEEHINVTYTEVQEEEDSPIKDKSDSKNKTHNELTKVRVRRSFNELKHPRQKFCTRWGFEFPWLKPNPADKSIGYCTICRRDLVCKKSHLDRHQKTFKHMRLQGFENVYTINEPEADLIEAHTTGYLENDDVVYEDEIAFDDETVEYTTIKVEPAKMSPSNVTARPKSKTLPKKRPNVETSPTMYAMNGKIEREVDLNSTARHEELPERRREMSDFYYMPRLPPKDSFDLFFESISATVKNLPPKLAAEVKSRVSQLIAEFELRAICEKEAQEKAATGAVTTISAPVTNVSVVDQSICSSSSNEVPTRATQEGQALAAHYVYSYQSK